MENTPNSPNQDLSHPVRNKIVYVAGLTGIGKTKLSVELAKHIKRAEIINCDSLQFYKVGSD